jgi:hypothetical protein
MPVALVEVLDGDSITIRADQLIAPMGMTLRQAVNQYELDHPNLRVLECAWKTEPKPTPTYSLSKHIWFRALQLLGAIPFLLLVIIMTIKVVSVGIWRGPAALDD